MAITLPRIEVPRLGKRSLTRNGSLSQLAGMDLPSIELPNVEIPTLERPHVDLPKLDLPKLDLPKLDLPKVDLGSLDVPAIGKRIDDAARDLRSLRIVRQPSAQEARVRSASAAGIGLLGGLGLGMALMYFFDPRRGQSRRNRFVRRIADLVAVVQNAFTGGIQGRGESAQAALGLGPSAGDPGAGVGPQSGTESAAGSAPRVPELATTQGG